MKDVVMRHHLMIIFKPWVGGGEASFRADQTSPLYPLLFSGFHLISWRAEQEEVCSFLPPPPSLLPLFPLPLPLFPPLLPLPLPPSKSQIIVFQPPGGDWVPVVSENCLCSLIYQHPEKISVPSNKSAHNMLLPFWASTFVNSTLYQALQMYPLPPLRINSPTRAVRWIYIKQWEESTKWYMIKY